MFSGDIVFCGQVPKNCFHASSLELLTSEVLIFRNILFSNVLLSFRRRRNDKGGFGLFKGCYFYNFAIFLHTQSGQFRNQFRSHAFFSHLGCYFCFRFLYCRVKYIFSIAVVFEAVLILYQFAEKILQQILVRFLPEQFFKSEIREWIDIFLCHGVFGVFARQRYGFQNAKAGFGLSKRYCLFNPLFRRGLGEATPSPFPGSRRTRFPCSGFVRRG